MSFVLCSVGWYLVLDGGENEGTRNVPNGGFSEVVGGREECVGVVAWWGRSLGLERSVNFGFLSCIV